VFPVLEPFDTYLSLCSEVYELSKPTAPKDAYRFYRDHMKAVAGITLEPMCGTGRFLLPLLEEGFAIHGFDASVHMLSKLYEKAATKHLTPHVWHGFAQNFNRKETYDLIIIPSGSFCLITNEDEVRSMLRSFYHHLTESGMLLFEVEIIHAVSDIGQWKGSIWPKPDDTTIILSQLTTFDSGICKSFVKYEQIVKGTVTHTEIEEYNLIIYEQTHLLSLLKAVGFEGVRIHKAFDSRKKPNQKDVSVVYECRKCGSI
jgi:hypothetical protein